MNTRRARFIALQTLLTVVLMGVIVVTLINPKSENTTLFAVDVPGAGTIASGPPSYEPQSASRHEHGGGEPGRAEGGPANGPAEEGAATSPTVAAAGATGAPPLAAPPETTTPAPPAEGPTGDQYDDTLARLSDAVN